jgi:hypothetical protein
MSNAPLARVMETLALLAAKAVLAKQHRHHTSPERRKSMYPRH